MMRKKGAEADIIFILQYSAEIDSCDVICIYSDSEFYPVLMLIRYVTDSEFYPVLMLMRYVVSLPIY